MVGSTQSTDRRPHGEQASYPAAKRCLWLTKGLGRGGVERLLVDMQPLVDPGRFHIDVAYVLPWKDSYHGELERGGASVTCLGGSRGLVDLRWLRRLVRLLRSGDYDLIHTHAPTTAVAVRVLTLGRNAPAIVHTEHNLWGRYRWPTRVMNSATYLRNHVVIAVSDSVAATIEPLLGWRRPVVETVHHGTSLSSIRSFSADERRRRRVELGLSPDGFLIGNVGNLTAKKDHRTLLESLAADGAIAAAELVIIGDGPLRADLELAAAELGVTDRTVFLGNRDDVFDLLPLFDAFSMSSRFEGFPIALVEAMATGLPCVVTTVGGIPEIISDGENGVLVDPGSPEELRAGLESVMQSPSDAARLGKAARVSAEELDLSVAVGRTMDVYDRALDQRGA